MLISILVYSILFLCQKCNDDNLIIVHCSIIHTTSLTTIQVHMVSCVGGGGNSPRHVVLEEYNPYDRVKDALHSHFVLPVKGFT